MLRLIKAELYKTFNRAYYYVFLLCAVWPIISIIAAICFSNVPVTTYFMMTMGMSTLIAPVFLVLMIVGTITNEEIKEKTLRNTISFGTSRSILYLAKIIASIILSLIAAAVILGAFLGISFAFLEHGSELTASFMNGFFLRILSAVPLYTAAIAIAAIMGFTIKSEMVFSFAYAGLFVAVKPIMNILGFFVSDIFTYIGRGLITTQLSNLGRLDITGIDMLRAAGLGLIYTVVLVVIGIITFRKQEIK